MSYGWLFLNSGCSINAVCEECVFTKCRISEQKIKYFAKGKPVWIRAESR